MNHRMNTPLVVYRVGRQQDADNLFSDRKAGKIADLKCFVVRRKLMPRQNPPLSYTLSKRRLGFRRQQTFESATKCCNLEENIW